MDATSLLLDAFVGLQPRQYRQDALRTLVDRLDQYDVRYLQTLLSQTTFQVDIISGLPLELVALVFQNIDPVAVYPLRRVSSSWQRILSSPEVVKNTLRHFYGYNVISSSANAATADAFYREKTQQIQRLRLGTPYSMASLNPPEMGPSPPPPMMLIEDTIVWLLNGSRAARTWNLRTGRQMRIQGEARETILELAVSDHIVVLATSSGFCYVKPLDERPLKKFRLQSTLMFQSVHCDQRVVVCGKFNQDSIEVYTWDYDTGVGRSLNLEYSCDPIGLSRYFILLLDAGSGLIHIFASKSSEDYTSSTHADGPVGAAIFHATYDLHGKRVADGQRILERVSNCTLSRVTPIDRNGSYALEVLPIGTPPSTPQVLRLQYDRKTMIFTYREQKFKYKNRSHSFCWGEAYFNYFYTRNEAERTVINVPVSFGTMSMRRLDGGDLVKPVPCGHREINQIFVNDKFVIYLHDREYGLDCESGCTSRLSVFCFERETMQPNGLGPHDEVEIFDT